MRCLWPVSSGGSGCPDGVSCWQTAPTPTLTCVPQGSISPRGCPLSSCRINRRVVVGVVAAVWPGSHYTRLTAGPGTASPLLCSAGRLEPHVGALGWARGSGESWVPLLPPEAGVWRLRTSELQGLSPGPIYRRETQGRVACPEPQGRLSSFLAPGN